MASFPKEHDTLYFDAITRTQKKESVLALIMATYYAKKNNSDDNVKDDISKRLEYAYGLFRDNVRGSANGVGSYIGTESQFSKQYTLGLEMGIWKNSELDLNDLALKVANNEITITEYFDVVLLNYIKPINGKIIHPLFQILNYIKNTNGESIQKQDFLKALALDDEDNNEAINALYNILIGTSYFNDGNNTLVLSEKYNIDNLISKCNKEYLGDDGYARAKKELENNDEKYIEYLISINDEIPSDEEIAFEIESEEKIDDRKTKFKKWLVGLGRFSQNTINNYSYYINYIKKKGYTDYDLYSISDISIINDLIHKFNDNKEYASWNIKNNYIPSNSLAQYKDFLIDKKGDLEKKHYVVSIKDYSTNHKLYFDKYGYMYWEEGQTQKYKVNDIIYLYFSEDNGKEIQKIKKKAVVSEIHVPGKRIISENYYSEMDLDYYKNKDYYIKVTLVSEIESDDLILKILKEKFDFNPPQLGSTEIKNESLIRYIESYFDDINIENGKEYVLDDFNRIPGGYNKIYYGVPGCGKSYAVDLSFSEAEYKIFRTTFHPEYTNSDFVGQIIPTAKDGFVDYNFHPGAFTLALKYALKHKSKRVCLIIEEINRGNSSAIFGDIFQLLDRDKSGRSKYEIYNGPILDYLSENEVGLEKIYIPSNMWIVATMNTSDQNVFTLDTAFKRRWKMEYIKNEFADNKESEELRTKVILSNKKYPNVTWEKFVDIINNKIITDTSGINGEDKQLGVYFVSVEEIDNKKEFAEKILSYLWEDVAKIDKISWFGSIKSYEKLLKAYNESYLDVFNTIFKDEKVDIDEQKTIEE